VLLAACGGSEVDAAAPAAPTETPAGAPSVVGALTAPTQPVTLAGPPRAAPPAPRPAAPAAPAVSGEPGSSPVPIEASGQLSEDQEAVLRAVATCVHQSLERGHEPRGALDVELFVSAEGRVKDVRLSAAYTGELAKCADARLRGLAFAPRPGAGDKLVRYPIDEAAIEDPRD
jgi:hypothetical protein